MSCDTSDFASSAQLYLEVSFTKAADLDVDKAVLMSSALDLPNSTDWALRAFDVAFVVPEATFSLSPVRSEVAFATAAACRASKITTRYKNNHDDASC